MTEHDVLVYISKQICGIYKEDLTVAEKSIGLKLVKEGYLEWKKDPNYPAYDKLVMKGPK